MNTQHQISVHEFPHTCGGYEINVTCTCGYEGVEARIGIGCADRDEMHTDLDATHNALLGQYYRDEDARQVTAWQAAHPE